MSLLTQLCLEEPTKPSVFRTVVRVIYALVFLLAVFLAIKDMNLLTSFSTKIWVLLLAVLMPELYIILHGISSSSMGVSFFTGSPIESRMKDYGLGGHHHHVDHLDHDAAPPASSFMKAASSAPKSSPLPDFSTTTPSASETSSSLF